MFTAARNRNLNTLLIAALLLTAGVAVRPSPSTLGSLGEAVDRALIADAKAGISKMVSVIVGKKDPSDESLERTVARSGGSVDKALPIVDGFSASVPSSSLEKIARHPNLRSLSKNRKGKFEVLSYDETNVQSSAPKSTGATGLWQAADYGSGIGVALIDTGVSPMNDFTALNYRIVHGPDLSGEFNLVDSFGHGTVMAGIIAGDGYDSQSAAGGAWVGIAPKAWLVSVKVAGANGVADVSTVLAAMHWVAAYRDLFNIRVMNLSWGTNSTQSYMHDPLNYAVERLWQLGITPVIAAGNSGSKAGSITKPGDDPFAITVGAYNDKQNVDLADDVLPEWSGRGPTLADGITKPDVLAPGRYIIASRSYGSTIEKTYPKALYAPSYIRGSGTSQAAAAVSGAAALLIKLKPHLSPAQVKYALMSTASPMGSYTANAQGAGRISLAAAASSTDEGRSNMTTPPAGGLGSLEASRGGLNVQTDCNGDGTLEVITGEITVQCEPWNPSGWTGASWNGDAWTGASWNGASWNGASWNGASWNGASWNGGSWNGASWNGASWNGGSWNGASWNNVEFSGASWNGASWNGASWNGASWNGGSWNGASWNGASWNGASWNGASWNNVSWTTGTYDEFTSSGYDDLDLFTGSTYDDFVEFMTAFWGARTPQGRRLPGESAESTTKIPR